MTKSHLSALTGIRGLAASWVLIHHLLGQYPIQDNMPVWIEVFANNGWLGVDLFFILSGFVMSYIHQEDFHNKLTYSSYKRFLILRFARVYPVHCFITLSLIPIYLSAHYLFGYTSPINSFSLEKLLYALTLTNGVGFADSTGWNLPSWSVGSECFAYLMFPLATWAVFSKPMSIRVCILASIIILLIAIYLGYSYSNMTQFMMPSSGTLIRISSEFTLGCLLYNIYKQSSQTNKNRGASFSFIALLVLISLNLPHQWDFLYIIVFLLLIWGLTSSYGIISQILSHRIAVYFGEISYSIYLSHGVVFMVMQTVYKKILPPDELWSICIATISYIGLTWLISHILFHVVEKKARGYLKGKLLN